MKYFIGALLGVLFTVGSLYCYTKNAYIAVDCDPDKYSPMWESAYDVLTYYLPSPELGVRCYKGAFFVLTPGKGKLYDKTMEIIKEEYGRVPKGLEVMK